MSTLNWLANLSGARHRRRPAAVAPLRSVLMPPRPMPPEAASLAAELLAERKRLTADDLWRDEFAAASVDFMLRTQDALHAREHAKCTRAVIVLAVLLALVSAALFALAFLVVAGGYCVGPL